MSAIKIADNYISECEYLDGEVFAMAGSSVQHNRIAMNIANFIMKLTLREEIVRYLLLILR